MIKFGLFFVVLISFVILITGEQQVDGIYQSGYHSEQRSFDLRRNLDSNPCDISGNNTCVRNTATSRRECKRKEGCKVQKCNNPSCTCQKIMKCTPTYPECEDTCRKSAVVTARKCRKYAILGCKVGNCFGPSGAGSSCTKVKRDFAGASRCTNPLTYSSFYQFGHTWSSTNIFPVASRSDAGNYTYATFPCDVCTKPCESSSCPGSPTIDGAKALNDAGVTLAQIKEVCEFAGFPANIKNYPLYDCAGTYLENALRPALAGC
ncbi:MAG: hypothetical protein AAGH46_11475 [Bacteroidota bacterium]